MSTARPQAGHLTTRAIDFWLLGGASIVLWMLMFALEGDGRENWAVDHHFVNLLAVSGSLALVGNYPHFMASYRLAYAQGMAFVLRNWFQLLLVPAVLLLSLGYAFTNFDSPAPGGAWPGLNQVLLSLGLKTQIGLAPSLGKEVMSLLIQFMFFTVGWHYAKQTYGCMRVMSHFEGYRLGAEQWRLVKAALFSVWFCSFAWANTGNVVRDMHGVDYVTLGLPPWVNLVAMIAFVYLTVSVALMFKAQKQATGSWPSANVLVAPIAFVLWWLPLLVQIEFYLWIVPFFHSVQYLAFVYKIENSRLASQHPETVSLRGGVIALVLIAVGFAAFEFVPNGVDTILGTRDSLGVWFFFAAAALFINVHHYFIDNVIWRFQNPRIRDHLLS